MRPIAFYLPQFHAIPENDRAYGEGFTEWTNTRKARPLFPGHYQPRLPMNGNYYCLLDPKVLERQAALAKANGIYGFCYYHYWFRGGKRLLEKPVEEMLRNPRVELPFCLCWANENWSARWDGGNKEIIVAQDYGNSAETEMHLDYLAEFFADPRYIRIDGKPLFLIYKPELIPQLAGFVRQLRRGMRKRGFVGIDLAVQYPKYYQEGLRLHLFDHYIQFQPRFVQMLDEHRGESVAFRSMKRLLIGLGLREAGKRMRAALKREERDKEPSLMHRSYREDWEAILSCPVDDRRLLAGAFVDWDNTPRNRNGLVYDGADPEAFRGYLARLAEKVQKEYSSDLVFLNAWNEWAEGAYLEPDERYGYRYLAAVREAVEQGEGR